MVREARFAFDDEFEDSDPHRHVDFTEEDDRFLDAFSQPGDQHRSGRQRPKKTEPQRKSDPPKKHLSDADWLSPKPPSRSRRRKSA